VGNGKSQTKSTSHIFERMLTSYRDRTTQALLETIPDTGAPYLYDLVGAYPRRLGKGVRGALCLATCAALGGDEHQALNSAVAIELFHNAFLIHDDVQDQSVFRRGGKTLACEYGVAIAVNVGNATNLMALQRLMENRRILGAALASRVVCETERMLHHSLEGQASELAWIRDNRCELEEQDYLEMCLKKTSWYSFIYPMRIGALVAEGSISDDRFCRFGWYLGAAFQVQDDILNLVGDYSQYGKELCGDLWEGKRTLMVIHLLGHCTPSERNDLTKFFSKSRSERTAAEVNRIYELMRKYGSIEEAQRSAQQLAGAALIEGLAAFGGVEDSRQKRFIFDMIRYAVHRRS
jgi:geranylgeranyl diphosphate synthase, type II